MIIKEEITLRCCFLAHHMHNGYPEKPVTCQLERFNKLLPYLIFAVHADCLYAVLIKRSVIIHPLLDHITFLCESDPGLAERMCLDHTYDRFFQLLFINRRIKLKHQWIVVYCRIRMSHGLNKDALLCHGKRILGQFLKRFRSRRTMCSRCQELLQFFNRRIILDVTETYGNTEHI